MRSTRAGLRLNLSLRSAKSILGRVNADDYEVRGLARSFWGDLRPFRLFSPWICGLLICLRWRVGIVSLLAAFIKIG